MPEATKRLTGKPTDMSKETESAAVPGIPQRPELSDDIANEAWDILCEELSKMEVLATSDQMIMELFCETKSLWIAAKLALLSEGSVLEGAKGGSYVNPRANLETMYAKRLESYLSAMGLSPASRAGVSKVPRIDTKEGKSRFFKVVG